MKYIFDFDDVLFNNTRQFKPHMFALIAKAGVPREAVEEYYEQVRQREFSLEEFIRSLFSSYGIGLDRVNIVYENILKESPKFINGKLLEAVHRIGKDNCYIVTNGDQKFQEDKIRYSGIEDFFVKAHVRIVSGSKKEKIKEICEKNKGEEVVFIDDKRQFIDEINLKDFPNLTTIHYKEEEFQSLMHKIKGNTNQELKRR